MDKSKLMHCGFGIYFDEATGRRYEDVGNELVEVDEELSEIEQSFVESKMKKKKGVKE